MGITATISRLKPDSFEHIKKEKKFPAGHETGSTCIDKTWEIISFVLVGKLDTQKDKILSEIIFPKENIVVYKDENMTEGFSYSSPNRVKEINDHLQLITEPIFKQLFEERDFSKSCIYPGWNKSQIDFDYVFDNFIALKEIYETAVKNEEYLAIVISY